MKSTLFFIVFVLYVTCATAISFDLGSGLDVVSNEISTSIEVEIVTGASKVVINALNGADIRYVKFEGNSLSISSSNVVDGTTGTDGVSSAVSLNPQSVTYMLMAIVTLGALSSKIGFRSFFLIGSVLAILCIQAPVFTEAQSGGSFQIILQVPSNFSFDSLSIDMELGTINLGSLEVDILDVSIGVLGAGTGGVTIGSLGVVTSASISSNGPISVGTVFLRSTLVDLNFISQSNVNLTFPTYRGTVHLNHSDTSVLNLIGTFCQWQASTNYQFGDCESATGSNELRISAQGNIDVNFGEFCPADYRDPPAIDLVPQSPAVTSTVASITYNFPSKWVYRETSSGSMANLTQNGAEFVVSQSGTAYNEAIFWLVCPDCLPYLRPNVNYDFSMDFKQSAQNPNINTTNSNVVSIQVVVLKNIGWPAGYTLLSNITNNTAKTLVSSNFQGPFNVTDYATFMASFSTNESFWSGEFAWDKRSGNTTNLNKYHAMLGIRVQLFSANQGTPVFYFKNMKLTKNEETFQTGTVLNQISELVQIQKPDWITLDANNRTGCPWEEDGLLAWHDPATWGGSVPDPTSVITLPANSKVLVTSCSLDRTAVYNQIVIPYGSELIFSDSQINLQISSIVVNGKLRIGSETCRIFSEMTFTFVGSSTTADVMGGNMGAKGIGVSPSGSIDVHGKLFQQTWTRLKRTAMPGDDRVIIQDPVTWEVGQQVVITTTILTDEWWPQNEVMEIAAISGNVVQFTTPLKYHHYAGIEYQAEVGLLSRRIVFQGDEGSETDQFGGHVIVRGEGRFSGVQAIRMGQKNRIARYPFHFHMMDEAPESYISDCSCLHTYFRCITIHRTNSSLVTRNVAFDVTGHCYYLEDGVEEKNTFTWNLAVFVHVIGTPAAGPGQDGQFFNQSANLSQPADAAAAGFYITNAYNTYIGNAASGGWTGFSFPNLPLPIGASAGMMMDPSARPNLVFESNTIHSTGYEWSSGSCIYTGGKLWISNSSSGALTYASGRYSRQTRIPGSTETYDPVNLRWNAGGTPLWMQFNNTRAALCNAGFNHWGDRLDIWSYEGHDVGRASTIFGESSLVNAIVEAFSANPINGLLDSQGFQFYDTSVKSIVVDVIFRNFQPRVPTPGDMYGDNYVIISMTHSDKFKPQGISATKNITHVNVNRTMYIGHKIENTGSSRYFNFIDWDGTASNSTGPAVIGSHSDWWYLDNSCRKDWGVWICNKTANFEVANLNIYWNASEDACVEPPLGNSTWIGNVSMWGDGISMVRSAPFTTCPGVTGVTNKGWYLWMPQGSPRDMTIYTILIPNNQSVYFAARYPNTTTFNISTDYKWGTTGDGPVTQAANFSEMQNSNGNKYFWDNNYLILKLVNKVLPSPAYYQRGGIKVYSVQSAYRYIVNATNCGGSGRFCDYADEVIPSYLLS